MSPRPILPRTFGFGGALVAGVMADYWTFDQKAARWHIVKDDSFFSIAPWRAWSDQYPDSGPIPTSGPIDRPWVTAATEDAVIAALKAYAALHTPLATPTGKEPTNFGGEAVPPPLPPVPTTGSTDYAAGYAAGYSTRGLIATGTMSADYGKGVDAGAYQRGWDDWQSAKVGDKKPDGSPAYDKGWRAAYDASKGTTPAPAPVVPDVASLTTDAARIKYGDALIRLVLPASNAAQRQIIGAIGRFESLYGVSGKFAPLGVPSFNWGAVTAQGTDPYFIASDKDATGKTIEQRFAKFTTGREGLLYFMRRWTKSGVDAAYEKAILEASGDGSADVVADLMYGAGYYTGVTPDAAKARALYAQAIYDSAKVIAATVGEPLAVAAPAFPGPSPDVVAGASSSSVGPVLAVGALVGLFLLGRSS